MQPAAQEVFIRQWHECRGYYDFEDWFERAELTLRFYAENEWDGIRWSSGSNFKMSRGVTRV